MNREFRRRKIKTLLQQNKHVLSDDLSREFKVSQETIRRDLISLEKENVLKRVYGGAELDTAFINNILPPFEIRKMEHSVEKNAIAEQAVKLINNDDVIFIDPGTTTFAMFEKIPLDKKLTIVTNSSYGINEMKMRPNIMMFSIGGVLHRESMSFGGESSLLSINNLNINSAFISAAGVSLHQGVMGTYYEPVLCIREIIEKANNSYLLCDSSKFYQTALIKVCELSKIKAIITDKKIPRDLKNDIEKIGVEVQVV